MCCRFRVGVRHALDGVHHGMTMVRVGWGEGASNPTFLAGRERNAQAGMGFRWVQVPVGVRDGNAERSELDAGFDIVSSVGGACIRCSPWDT